MIKINTKKLQRNVPEAIKDEDRKLSQYEMIKEYLIMMWDGFGFFKFNEFK